MLRNNLFGVFLRDKRKQKDVSLRELAQKINISHSYLSNIESGKKLPPSNQILIALADELMLDLESKRLLFDIAAETKELYKGDYNLPVDIS